VKVLQRYASFGAPHRDGVVDLESEELGNDLTERQRRGISSEDLTRDAHAAV